MTSVIESSRRARALHAVSLMATGSLLAVLVLWGIGTFDPQVGRGTAVADGVTVDGGDGGERAAGGVSLTKPLRLPATAAELLASWDGTSAAAGGSSDGDQMSAGGRSGQRTSDGEPSVSQRSPAGQAPAATSTAGSTRRHVAPPALVEVPSIGVAASVIELGLTPQGALEVPSDFGQTGWWSGGPEPGEIGPSVIVGHVDSHQGPAVFFDLRELAHDDLIRVTRTDGSAATFAVRSTLAVEKDAFPTELVYGPTEDSELRLITCDGDFADGSYLGNLIVTAELLEEHPAPTRPTHRTPHPA